jgi:energy-coupling factor transport system substrate-specific component
VLAEFAGLKLAQGTMSAHSPVLTTPRLMAVALCAALNFCIGSIVYLIKLPIYLDSIGTILAALLLFPSPLLGFLCAWLSGVLSLILSGLLLNPFVPYFEMTDVAIALFSAFVIARSANTFRADPLPRVRFGGTIIVYGVCLGIVAALVSAPVVAFLFGGVTGSGSAFLVALFLKSGQQLLNAAVLSGLSAEPIDKTVQVLLAVLLYRATPNDFLVMLRAPDKLAVSSDHT